MASSLWIWFAFPWWLVMLSLLYLLAIQISSLEKCLFKSAHLRIYYYCCYYYYYLLLSCMCSLCILDIRPLSGIWIANIVSHSGGCLFIFLVSFTVQKLFSLIRSHLFIFVFISITLGDGSKKIFLRFMSKGVLPMFSARSFIVSGLI